MDQAILLEQIAFGELHPANRRQIEQSRHQLGRHTNPGERRDVIKVQRQFRRLGDRRVMGQDTGVVAAEDRAYVVTFLNIDPL